MNTLKQKAEDYIAWETHESFRKEILDLLQEGGELKDRFYKDLTFGTGGLRGIIGGGFNRMNPYVVMRTTEGIARYLKEKKGDSSKIVIGYDSRRYSRLFALVTSGVLTFHGYEVFLFQNLRPTPQLSYAVRVLQADCGIMITASHNPPEYNGYKVYWDDGSQIVAPVDQEIFQSIQLVKGRISSLTEEEAREKGCLHYLGEDMDERFLSEIHSYIQGIGAPSSSPVSVAYTPLHGTGATLQEPLFQRLNITFHTVASQREPDGNFPTVDFPNPEDPSALTQVIHLAEEKQSDLLLAADPDADRIGVGVRHEGKIHLLTGNQLGVLVGDYLCSRHNVPLIFVNTIVTTDLQEMIVQAYGGELIQTITGFKHIAGIIRQLEEEGRVDHFVAGTEESFGLLLGTFVRDKDSVTAAALITEMVRNGIDQGKTLIDRLHELYWKHEFFYEETISLVLPGEEGVATMKQLMRTLRSAAVRGKISCDRYDDYKLQKTFSEGRSDPIPGAWSSDVLKFYFKNFGWVAVRPSGTEPKLKIYYSFHTPVQKNIAATEKLAKQSVQEMRKSFESVLHSLVK